VTPYQSTTTAGSSPTTQSSWPLGSEVMSPGHFLLPGTQASKTLPTATPSPCSISATGNTDLDRHDRGDQHGRQQDYCKCQFAHLYLHRTSGVEAISPKGGSARASSRVRANAPYAAAAHRMEPQRRDRPAHRPAIEGSPITPLLPVLPRSVTLRRVRTAAPGRRFPSSCPEESGKSGERS